jgi:poly(A) polymerase
VVPRNVSREDWFNKFPELLVKMAPKGAITELQSIQEAFVPIIKFEYSGIDIDLIFSRLDKEQVPSDQNLLDDSVLQGLDDLELRSLNGTRVTDEILELVPQKAVFKLALRAIKLWAQRRAIYANKLGFPGGVAWAMLVARVCQLYPQAVASKIVQRFFHIIGKWQWPQPVLLKTVKTYHPGMNARVWNPRVRSPVSSGEYGGFVLMFYADLQG